MSTAFTLDEASRIARERLDDATYAHSCRVAKAVPDEDILRPLALLHDVLEDNPGLRFEDLGIEDEYGDLEPNLGAITRQPDEPYTHYIQRLSWRSAARKVKIADLLDNLERMDAEHVSLAPRYARALRFLLAADGALS